MKTPSVVPPEPTVTVHWFGVALIDEFCTVAENDALAWVEVSSGDDDIVLAGRYAEWEYYNSDHAFIAGRDAAERARETSADPSRAAIDGSRRGSSARSIAARLVASS